MKSTSTSLLLALITFILYALADQQILADTPPACLLQALNIQSQPAKLSAICGNEATDVQRAIASLCGNIQSAAQSAFIATCSSAGSSVAPYTSTLSSSQTTNGPPSDTYVHTTIIDASTIVTSTEATATKAGPTSSSSSAGGASATGNAAAEVKQVGSFAAAVIAIAGVVAIL